MKIKFTTYNLKVGGRFLIGLAGEATLQIPLTDYEGLSYDTIFTRIDKFATFNRVEYDKQEVINLLNSLYGRNNAESTNTDATTGPINPAGPNAHSNAAGEHTHTEHPATITGSDTGTTPHTKARRQRKARIHRRAV